MDNQRFAEDFTLRIHAGEFDGCLYQAILALSPDQRRQIFAMATSASPAFSQQPKTPEQTKENNHLHGTSTMRNLW
jgi:hypothetical protein